MTGPDEQLPPADGPAEVRAEALLLERAIGGWRGVIDSGLPTAVFVIAYVVTGGTLRTSLIAAIAAGVLIVGWRLIRREKLGQVASEFDRVHDIHRAVQVGSVDAVISASVIRPRIIQAIEATTA